MWLNRSEFPRLFKYLKNNKKTSNQIQEKQSQFLIKFKTFLILRKTKKSLRFYISNKFLRSNNFSDHQ